jgi:hypothetical protein
VGQDASFGSVSSSSDKRHASAHAAVRTPRLYPRIAPRRCNGHLSKGNKTERSKQIGEAHVTVAFHDLAVTG